MGFITDYDIPGVLLANMAFPSITLKYYEIDPNVSSYFPRTRHRANQVIRTVARRLRSTIA